MPEYLVTGGCGFIGSHLCDALIRKGHRVRVLDDLSTGSLENLSEGATLFKGDIRDPEIVSAAMAGCDGCYHLAAVASVERSIQEWLETHRINLTGTIQIFDTARRAGSHGTPIPVVYASSAAVYGDQGDAPIAEDAPQRPTSAYGSDKLGCEHHARVAALVHGVPTTGLRFFNVYGPRQDPKSPYSGVISIFSDRMARREPIKIFGDGRQTRDFVYVVDVARALMLALEHISDQPRVLNVCTGRSVSVEELAVVIADRFDYRQRFEYLPRRGGEIRHSLGDPSAAAQAISFEAKTSLLEGLALTVRSATPEPAYAAQ
jgi:UDP-glucose 4-epimerase